MLDVVSCGLDIYMLELKLFHGKNEALNGLGKVSKHKGCAAENFFRREPWKVLQNLLYLDVEKSKLSFIYYV